MASHRKALVRYLLWLLAVLWFAAGISGVRARSDRAVYNQVRGLAAFTFAAPEGAPARPGAAMAALPFYAAARAVGTILGDDPADPLGYTAQLTAFAAAVAAAIALALIALIGLELGVRPSAAVALAVLLAIASPLLTYASRLAPPVFGMLALTMTVYPLLRLGMPDDRLRIRLMLGAGLGLMPLLDDALLLAWPLFLVWVLRRAKGILGRPSYAFAVLAPVGAGLLVFLASNLARFGGVLNGPGGAPLWTHFWRQYVTHAPLGEDFLFHQLLPGLGFWLFNDGTVPQGILMARHVADAWSHAIVLGVVAWFPLLLAGLVGRFVAGGDEVTRHPLRLLSLLFWFAIVLRAVDRDFVVFGQDDLAATLPMWLGYLVGLGYFLEYHLVRMRGFFFKNFLRVCFVAALAVSAGNAWMQTAGGNIGPQARVMISVLATPVSVPAHLGEPGVLISAGPREAIIFHLNNSADWLLRDPLGLALAVRPGVGNLPLFAGMLALLAAIAAAFALVLRRRFEGDDEVEEDFPPRDEVEEPDEFDEIDDDKDLRFDPDDDPGDDPDDDPGDDPGDDPDDDPDDDRDD